MKLQLGRTIVELSIFWLHEGWPSDVRHVLSGVPSPWPRHLVVAAPTLSPGALELLKQRDANWMDEAGNARVVVPPGLVVTRMAPPAPQRNTTSSGWSSSKVAIAEALLAEPHAKHELAAMASRAGWSVSQTSNALRAFDAAHWTVRHGPQRGAGVWRSLDNPGSLLEAWAAYLADHRPRRRLGHRIMRDPLQFLAAELAPALRGLQWAATGWAGLALAAPYLTTTPGLQIYVASDDFEAAADAIFSAANVRNVDSGANVELWHMTERVILAHGLSTLLPVVNAPRLYADLLAVGGRGDEAAQHVREVLIGY